MYSLDSPVIKKNVLKSDWKFDSENMYRVALCINSRIGEDRRIYYDIIAEFEYEEWKKIEKEVKASLPEGKWWTMGGVGLGFLYPLQTYSDKLERDRSHLLFYVDTKIEVDGNEFIDPYLLDTGAGVCHITFPLWKKLNQHNRFFELNKELCKLVGILNPEDLMFKNIPITKRKDTVIGDGSNIKVFDTKIDSITFQKNKLGQGIPVTVKDITAKVLDHTEEHFIVGCNVIKYLKLATEPKGDNFTISIDFTSDGKNLLDEDRKNKKANFMTNFYNYEDVQHPEEYAPSNVFVSKAS